MGLRFIQPPVANWKKSSHGETERSRSPVLIAPFAVLPWPAVAISAQPGTTGDRNSTALPTDEFKVRDCAASEPASRIEPARHNKNLELCVINGSPGCSVCGLDSRERGNVSKRMPDIKTTFDMAPAV